MTIEALDAFGNDYYRVEISCREMPYGTYHGRAAVFRIDSGEQVSGVVAKGEGKESVLDQLRQQVPACIQALKMPPHEWQRINLRAVLVDFRKLNYELTGILASLNTSLRAGTLSENELHTSFWNARDKACKEGSALALKIAALSETDRIDLMTSPEDAYNDSESPWNMDDLNARSAVFDFIVNPSADVIAAHQAHLQRWG